MSHISPIDFYVSIIDNFGDMGFAVNLALSLREKHSDLMIRFFSDDSILFQKFFQDKVPDWIQYIPLEVLYTENPPKPATIIYSFFDYKIPKAYLSRFSYEKTIISFSYFLLHAGLESLHGTTYMLESGYDRVIHFVPSLLSGGGGVIINREIESEKKRFVMLPENERRSEFLEKIFNEANEDFSSAAADSKGQKIKDDSESRSEGRITDICQKKWISVFVYGETLSEILPIIKENTSDTIFWICGDVARVEESSNCRKLPFLSLVDYGLFLSLCDANIVRGENSLCQSLISGKSTLWDIYKENNGAHQEKIEDFLIFLSDFIPKDLLEIYARIFREFNKEGKDSAFVQFLETEKEFVPNFEIVSKYILEKSDLMGKLEEMILKNS